MELRPVLILLRLVIFSLLSLPLQALAADWVERSDAYALQVLEQMAVFSPEGAARWGLSQYDTEVADLGERLYERANQADLQSLALVRSARDEDEDPRVLQDLSILEAALQDSLRTRRLHHEQMLPYYNIHVLLFYSFRSVLDPRVDAARHASALIRLRRYNGREAGYEPITQLAIERTTERFDVPGLVGPYRGGLENDLQSAPQMVAGLKQMFAASELTGWEEDLALLESQLAAYADWLRSEMLPRTRASNALPAEIYADNLRQFGVTATPEELIREGQAAYQFIRSEMKALARQIARQRGWKDEALLPVIARFKQQSIPDDEILDLYRERLRTLEALIREHDIITLPKRAASIRLATPAEAAAVPASFMSPPQLINNTGQYGEFVLVQSNPALGEDARMDDWSHPAITWALTVHEARPGHELQFASLVENGTSLARSIFASNSANTEGWGLYAEAIMHEYLPPEGQLFNLYTRLMRAARMFLDPMVNTGAITRDDAERFLIEQGGMSRAMASSEADRYAFRMPGQATAYYFGYQNLMGLRTELELRLGQAFNDKAFHDFVIAQGLLPPQLLREAVLAHFTAGR